MIRRLYINNLRCLVNFELDFTDLPSSLIVGQNGTGKSSIIDALEIITDHVWKVEEIIALLGN
jgi:DNA repair exonuclease SbcCD ATPase subunit